MHVQLPAVETMSKPGLSQCNWRNSKFIHLDVSDGNVSNKTLYKKINTNWGHKDASVINEMIVYPSITIFPNLFT